MEVRTRFAPSPTGYLHIGGVRTALFNWLLARRHGGQFLLRIDDTDEARHVDDAVRLILDGLAWLGLDWDEGPDKGGPHAPYFQAQRKPLHKKALLDLIDAGLAYPCRAKPEELDAMREAAKANKQAFIYRGPDRDLSPSECRAIFEEEQCALRYKVPLGQTTVLNDHVRGEVEWQTDLLGDFTVARAGGDPLYNLASIVDDIETRITHIIRAEEHLSNTHPQILIARGLGATLPEFAHVPYVAAPGGKKKLSKRSPPPGVMVGLNEYQDAGYLPDALVNALARLGWSLDDKTELMSRQMIVENFSLDRITKAPAGLDPDKMYWMQDQYMRALPAETRVEMMVPYLQKAGMVETPISALDLEKVRRIDAASGDRIKLLSDIVRYGGMFFEKPLTYEAKAVKNLQKDDAASTLEKVRACLAELPDFEVPTLEAAISKLAEELGIGGKINHVLRGSTTGKTVGPGVYDCVSILGRDRALANIDQTQEAMTSGNWPMVESTAPVKGK